MNTRSRELTCRESGFGCSHFAGNWGTDGLWEKAAKLVREHGAALSALVPREICGQEPQTTVLVAA